MKTKEKRKVKEEAERVPEMIPEDYKPRIVLQRRPVARGGVAISPPRRLTGEPANLSEDERLSSAIDAALKEIDATRIMARSYDEEIARLGEETRRLITEMQRDLNLKAA